MVWEFESLTLNCSIPTMRERISVHSVYHHAAGVVWEAIINIFWLFHHDSLSLLETSMNPSRRQLLFSMKTDNELYNHITSLWGFGHFHTYIQHNFLINRGTAGKQFYWVTKNNSFKVGHNPDCEKQYLTWYLLRKLRSVSSSRAEEDRSTWT